MKNLVVIFGGKSVEHDISIITGLQIMQNIHPIYNLIPVYITREGEWWTGDKLQDAGFYENFETSKLKKCYFTTNDKKIKIKHKLGVREYEIDCALLALHGTNGEDGSIQGLLEMCGIPYTSASVLGSAVCMDKAISKAVMKSVNINTLPYYSFLYKQFLANRKEIVRMIKIKCGFPVIVKPCRLGSSVGISKCKTENELNSAIEFASHFDNKIIVEKAMEDFKEVNIACLGVEDKIECSVLEQIESDGDIFNFDEKYIKPKHSRKVDVKLDDAVIRTIQKYAKKAFVAFDCAGVVRMDFFIDKNNKVWLNEINTIPGSLAFYLWKDKKISFGQLISKLIVLAKEKKTEKERLNYVFKTEALINFSKIKSGKTHK